jgi:hypothetical protein
LETPLLSAISKFANKGFKQRAHHKAIKSSRLIILECLPAEIFTGQRDGKPRGHL